MNLAGFVAFVPMLAEDDAEEADRQSKTLNDGRVVQRWSPDRSIGDHFAKTLALTAAAWDVYLVYPPGVVWPLNELPQPMFWMHQLPASDGADQSQRLDPEALTKAVGNLINSLS